jgi:hypothetical protein
MKCKLLTLLSVLLTLGALGQTYDIRDFGARGDGLTLNTKSIQAAIDRAGAGGEVVVPEGRFLTGSLILHSGVRLHLAKGAVLLGSTSPYDYPYLVKQLNPDLSDPRYRGALVQAHGCSHIIIDGQGTIDGQGRALALALDSLFYAGKLDTVYYNLRRKRPADRPGDLRFDSCADVHITGITISNAAGWVQTYDLCKDLKIDHIRVESDAYWNNDGIDIVDCRRASVTDCFVNSADDGICLKSEHADALCDSIYIARCTVRSSASAVKFGTASLGGFTHIKVEQIKVYDTYRSAIALECVDGGVLRDVVVDGISGVNTGNPIFIRLGHRDSTGRYGSLDHVVIRNLDVQVPFGRPDTAYDLRGPALPFFHNPFPSSVTGLPDHPVKNVLLENIRISYPGGGNDGLAILPLYRLDGVPEMPHSYPEFSVFGELPAWGFYVRHVRGLTMRHISISARKKDYRPAYVFQDVSHLTLEQFDIRSKDNRKQIVLSNVRDATLKVNTDQLQRLSQN